MAETIKDRKIIELDPLTKAYLLNAINALITSRNGHISDLPVAGMRDNQPHGLEELETPKERNIPEMIHSGWIAMANLTKVEMDSEKGVSFGFFENDPGKVNHFISNLMSGKFSAEIKSDQNITAGIFAEAFGRPIRFKGTEQTLLVLLRRYEKGRGQVLALGQGAGSKNPIAIELITVDHESLDRIGRWMENDPQEALTQISEAVFDNHFRTPIYEDAPNCVPDPFHRDKPVVVSVKQAS